ncbi:MAG: transglutaminase-like domain-containing protein [Thermodesulfobacteriota bacterium]
MKSFKKNIEMAKERIIIFFIALLMASPAAAENYILNGDQASKINFQILQTIDPMPDTAQLILSFVVPVSFSSPTYTQKVTRVDFAFEPSPWKQTEKSDRRGNKIVEAVWQNPTVPIRTAVRLQAENDVSLRNLKTMAPFPMPKQDHLDPDYLGATPLVAADDTGIRRKAALLTRSSTTLFDAVQQILTWLVDHMHYVVDPTNFSATYSFQNGSGNCQNYSHLAAAMMRSVGIPVRIVNGITLSEPYDIVVGPTILTSRMALGRHAWIEVYFPDLGWVPFDPSGTEMFVSNRFIRVEVGVDNAETKQDGLIRWISRAGTSNRPQFKENIESAFSSDRVRLQARKESYGPRKLLLCPSVDAVFSKVAVEPPTSKITPHVSEADLKQLRYVDPLVFGNLEFPQNIDFLSARGPARQSDAGAMEMRKNFIVETAEYVTTQGRQYAQTFILDKPIQLQAVALALHKFGGQGQIWLELFKDHEGKPGEQVAASDILDLDQIPYISGYSWVDFSFERTPTRLAPGRYWVALGFTGSPVVNWFFSYGKPIGPQDGTRYKTIFDADWSRSLAFEFNYKVTGLTPR